MYSNRNEDLIDYPCNFPIKVMGSANDVFAEIITEVVLEHDPVFDASTIETRSSSKGNYLSLTVIVHATSRTQLDQLYLALSSHPMVKIVI